jgi:hypothetical protein
MNHKKLFPLLIVTAILLAGCAPLVTVENGTSFPVRVIVASGGKRVVVSPSPGENSTVDASEGAYQATVIPDAEWIEYAKLTRKVLNDQLAHADKLTGPQLLDVIRRLKEIAVQMQQYEQAAGSSASCGGKITEENSAAYVVVSASSSGTLVHRGRNACRFFFHAVSGRPA